MNKKILLLITCICLLVSITSCSSKKDIMEKYPSLDKNHIYKQIDVYTLDQMILNADNFYILMGFPMCPWCQSIMPVLDAVAKENDVKKIYYLDIKDIRDDETSDGYEKFHSIVDNVFNDAKDIEKNRMNAPTFIKVESGSMKAYHIDTVQTHVMNENMVLPPLTDEQTIELKNILKDIILA